MRPCYLLAAPAAAALIAVNACQSSPAQPTPPPPPACAFQLTATSSSFGFDGGTASIAVSTSAGCAWSARSESAWVTIGSGAAGTGPGTIALTIAANADAAAREGTIIVADQSLKLTQQGRAPCDYAIAPDTARFDSAGGAGLLTVATAAHCAWTATASDPWIALASSSGTGSGVLNYTVGAWSGTAEREATIRIAGAAATVRQSRDPGTCTYTVTPTEFVLHWHHVGGDIEVRTEADCDWTVADTADWLGTPGAESRRGTGTAHFVISTYTADATRRAPVEIRWPTRSAGQNVWVTQEGCRYGVYPLSLPFAAGGGTGSISVLTQPVSTNCSLGCPWTAESSASWIRITSGSPGSGDNPFHIAVGPNAGGARTGTIRVGGHTVTVAQAGS